MRGLMMLFGGFVLGFASATALLVTISPEGGTQQAVAQTAQQPAQRSQTPARPAATGGDEVFRLNGRGHVETYAEIDGADMPVLIDTGATLISLRESDARRAGYRLRNSDFNVPVNTANGRKYSARIVLRSVEIGSIRVRNVEALVSRDDQLGINLLGMSFLTRLDGFRVENGMLILEN
ncbi:MAG: TIGR02281 family clan AA aspartic protease [Pseudomonadota bacterium]